MRLTIDQLRRYAVARSLFRPTTLSRAIHKLGFVQADPIRAPARAQDLTLRHRVTGYRAGDLERRYPRLPIEEDFFVNYGFLPVANQTLMHPRAPAPGWSVARRRQADAVLAFIRERGATHPRVVDAHFAHGKTVNVFGGSSNASTDLLNDMHYRGLLRVARREGGTRVYAVREPDSDPPGRRSDAAADAGCFDALVDIVIRKYAPLPAASLGQLLSLLCHGVPQWKRQRAAALARARQRHPQARVADLDWYWPVGEMPGSRRWQTDERVRLLTPFDPVVWDRRRFALLWDWEYRFEAYTPAPRRKLGYYALPLLWREQVIGWANLSVVQNRLRSELGFVSGAAPAGPGFRNELAAELARVEGFLDL
jgi:uncharacterized protein YcaQ